MIRAGQLRHRVHIDEPVATRSEAGDQMIEWRCLGEVWAAIEPLRGRELLMAGQLGGVIDTRIRIRWSPGAARVSAKWRVRHRSTVYSVVSPLADVAMGGREIELMCQAGANRG